MKCEAYNSTAWENRTTTKWNLILNTFFISLCLLNIRMKHARCMEIRIFCAASWHSSDFVPLPFSTVYFVLYVAISFADSLTGLCEHFFPVFFSHLCLLNGHVIFCSFPPLALTFKYDKSLPASFSQHFMIFHSLLRILFEYFN